MELAITYRNIDKKSHKAIKKDIKRIVKQYLKAHLSRFNDGLIRLHVTVEQSKKNYSVLLHLHLPPRKILVAKETDKRVHNAIEATMKELSHQAEKHVAKTSGQEHWKRKQRRQRIKQFKADLLTLPVETQNKAKQTVKPLLPKLERYIKQEMTYLQANGDIPYNYPSMEDVRDEVLLKVKFNWDQLESYDEVLYQALIKATHEVLNNEIAQTQLHENDISLNEDILPDAMDQAEAMVGEDISEFYQPFEQLHIEDIIPNDNEELPEDLVDKNAKEISFQVLSSLPNQWRQIIVMVYREKLVIKQIAKHILPLSLVQVEQQLNYAEQFMLATLNEKGLGQIDKLLLQKLLR